MVTTGVQIPASAWRDGFCPPGFRAKSSTHYRIKTLDLERHARCQPTQVALGEAVDNVNGDQFSLCAAVDPETGRILPIRLFAHRRIVTTKRFVEKFGEKTDVEAAEVPLDRPPWLQAALDARGIVFRHEILGDRNPPGTGGPRDTTTGGPFLGDVHPCESRDRHSMVESVCAGTMNF